jgi:hypothetical protein
MTDQNNPRSSDYDSPGRPHGTQLVALIISWAIVAVPAAWGVAQTVRKSVPLFTQPAVHIPATRPGA